MTTITESLKDRVYRQLECDDEAEFKQIMHDVQRGGADSGWHGFVYYYETSAFYDENEDAIWELLEQVADELGHKHPLELIATFGGAKDVHGDDQFKNLLAWFVLEHVASQY